MILSTQNWSFIFDSHTSYLFIEIDSVNEWKDLKSYKYENPFLVEKKSEGGWKMGQKSAKKGCFKRKNDYEWNFGANPRKRVFLGAKMRLCQFFGVKPQKRCVLGVKNDLKWTFGAKPQKRAFLGAKEWY